MSAFSQYNSHNDVVHTLHAANAEKYGEHPYKP
jgi:hypothetical protein